MTLKLAGMAVVASLALCSDAIAGTVVSREFRSDALGRNWSYNVYLPDGHESATLLYPVLYLLHGNAGNHHNWVNEGRIRQTADALIAAGEIPPCIIVMPDAGTSWYVDRKEKMETALLGDLVPDVEKNWKAQSVRTGRVVAGLSMGGYGAMRLALRHPELFAAAALLSPAIYNPQPPDSSAARRVGVFGSPDFDPAIWASLNYPMLWESYIARGLAVPMYIVSGDDDEFFIEHEATRFYSLLRRNRQPAELRIVDGAHSWAVWTSEIGDAMKYVFRHAGRPVESIKVPEADEASGRSTRLRQRAAITSTVVPFAGPLR